LHGKNLGPLMSALWVISGHCGGSHHVRLTPFVPKADVVRCPGNGRKGPIGDLMRGPRVREAWTNRGQVLRRLGEPNGGQDYGSHQLAAVPQSVLHGGSPKSRDPLLVFRAAYRSDTHAPQATFGRLRIPLVLSVVRSCDGAHGCQIRICRGYPGNPGCRIAVWRVAPWR